MTGTRPGIRSTGSPAARDRQPSATGLLRVSDASLSRVLMPMARAHTTTWLHEIVRDVLLAYGSDERVAIDDPPF